MTDNEELIKNELFDFNKSLIDKVARLIRTYNEIPGLRIKVPNIAITYNNKVVEIIALYRRNNKSFYSSELRRVILRYLETKIMAGVGVLSSLMSFCLINKDKELTPEEAFILRQRILEFFSMYKACDDSLFDFDLEKEINKAIEYDICSSRKIGEEGGYDLYAEAIDEIINKYNEELKSIGINQRYTIPDELPDFNKLNSFTVAINKV